MGCEVQVSITEEETKKKTLKRCCDVNDKNVTLGELYEKLVEDNVCYATCWEMEVVDEY